jgi:predicted dehydrogenase
MTGKVRVGVIGTSWWTDLMYVPSLNSHPGAAVTAVCGRDAARAGEIAAKFGGARVFADYGALIGSGQVDAVVIATPDDLHYDMTMAALDAGLHVLCEKPLALNATAARAMHEKAITAKVKHMVLFTWRWQPHWRYAKHLIDTGAIGRPRLVRFHFIGNFALDPGYKWRFDGRRANGVTGDLGSHMIDFIEWYLGPATRVMADLPVFVDQSDTATPPPLPVNDAGFLIFDMANGARAEIHVSAVSQLGDEGVRVGVSLYGDEGSVEMEQTYFGVHAGVAMRSVRKGDAHFEMLKVPETFLEGGVDPNALFDPYAMQSAGPRLFIDAILRDEPATPDFGVGVRVQEIVDAALRSDSEKRWVPLG